MRCWMILATALPLVSGCARLVDTYQTWDRPGVSRETVDADYDVCEARAKADARATFGRSDALTGGFRTPEAIPGASGGASAFANDQREIDRRDYLRRDIAECMTAKGYHKS